MAETRDEHLRRITEWWDEKSDSLTQTLRTADAINGIIDDPKSSFHQKTYSLIRKCMKDLSGKRVLVPSSGDNHAVYSFALMGARVTSTDISERQIENASRIASEYGWDIEYFCDNTMTLERVESDGYDFVFTSNGVHVWICDLAAMYKSIYRVLRESGFYIMYDVHPFTRPFEHEDGKQPSIAHRRALLGKIRHVHHWPTCRVRCVDGGPHTALMSARTPRHHCPSFRSVIVSPYRYSLNGRVLLVLQSISKG